MVEFEIYSKSNEKPSDGFKVIQSDLYFKTITPGTTWTVGCSGVDSGGSCKRSRSGGLGCAAEVRCHQKPTGLPSMWNVGFERKSQDDLKVFDLSNC